MSVSLDVATIEAGLQAGQGAIGRILDGLTATQREAVTFGNGPLLVVAGAGTGKTTVLTRRIAYLIAAKLARPQEILALTFTEKAAREMEERVDVLVPYGYTEISIGTFHAFGDQLLREHALELGLTPDFSVLSQPEQVLFLREHMFRLPLARYRPAGNPTQYLRALASLFSRAKDEDLSPGEYLDYVRGLEQESGQHPEDRVLADRAGAQGELARSYALYQELMAQHGFVDFGDQVTLTLRLLRQHPAVLDAWRRRFRYILVDEFQDTNYAQFQLIKLLGGAGANVTVVGDDDQSIYKFRGAAISNILHFTEDYPSAHLVVLTENFRSTQEILDAAYRLVIHNNPERLEERQGIDKRLHSACGTGPLPEHRHFAAWSEETDAVAETVRQGVDAGEQRYGDYAILVRTNAEAESYLRALNLRGVPYRFTGNQGLYSRPEVRLCLAFLKALAFPDDSQSLYLLAASELYRVSARDLAAAMGAATRTNRPLLRVLEAWLELPPDEDTLSAQGRAAIPRLLDDLEKFRELALELSTGKVLYRFITDTGYLKRLSASGAAGDDLRIRNLARFFDILAGFERVAEEDRVPFFVARWELLREAGDDPAVAEPGGDEDVVKVLTVHKAKGLEFPVVLVVGMAAGRFPRQSRSDPLDLPLELVKETIPEGDFHLQEERRLCYVAMTRARKRLVFFSSRDTGGARARKVSRFVLEALDLPRVDDPAQGQSAASSLRRFQAGGEDQGEVEAPLPADQVLSLTPYQVDDYLTCPLKYKYVHVLRVPILRHHSVVYGQALHEAVREYFRRRLGGFPVSLEHLREAFQRCWSSEGFLTREHEEQRLKAGQEAVDAFFAREEARETLPTFVEKEFAFRLGYNRIAGRWDRVDQALAGDVIIDYKSSAVKGQKEADAKARESLQLGIYALAHGEIFGRLPTRVELHFLESGLIGTAVPDSSRLLEVRRQVEEAAEGIRARRFEAQPSFMACRYCAYREICPATARE